jgi:hypothetical protein
MPQVNKNQEITRRAIWKSYNEKDFYTGRPLEYVDMEIDHVIPISSKELIKEFIQYNDENKVIEDFDINSLYNLVPVSRKTNRDKSNNEFVLGNVLFYYQRTKIQKVKIEKLIKNMKNSRMEDDISSKFKIVVEKQKNKRETDNLIDFIMNEESYYTEKEAVYKTNNDLMLEKFTKRVGILAKLPVLDDVETSCKLFFKTREIQGCIIELDNKTVLSSLFDGLSSECYYRARSYVKIEMNEHDEKYAVLSLGNNKIKLDIDDFTEFCEVIDCYGKNYITRVKDIESELGTSKYKPSSRKNHYQIFHMDTKSWRKLIDFGRKHDSYKGVGKWDLFEPNGHFIKVFTEVGHKMYDRGYHAFFDSEYAQDIIHYPDMTNSDRIITWGLIPELDRSKEIIFDKRKTWNADYAIMWFEKEFSYRVLKKQMCKEVYNDLMYIEIKNKKVDSELIKYVLSELQRHFYGRPDKSYLIKKNDLQSLYDFILTGVSKNKRLNLHYCSSNLRVYVDSKEAFISEIEKLKLLSHHKVIWSFEIDLMFRSALSAYENTYKKLTSYEAKEILDQLKIFIEIANQDILLEKYAIDFF